MALTRGYWWLILGEGEADGLIMRFLVREHRDISREAYIEQREEEHK